MRVPRNFRTPARARRSFFVVKFHANLFNGSLAIANKRGDELFAVRRAYTCTHVRACESRRPHVRRTRGSDSLFLSLLLFLPFHARLCHTVAKNIKLILYLIRTWIPSSLWVSFCRDNRAILNRHEADNFFPPFCAERLPGRAAARLKYQSQYFQISARRLIFANYTRTRAVRTA